MNCDEARRYWDLYHDSEGDAELHFLINEHLASCADCTTWFARQSRLENLVSRQLAISRPDPRLWQSVLERAGLQQPASRRKFAGPALLVACAAVLLVIGITVWLGGIGAGSRAAPSLSANAAEVHAQLTDSPSAVGFHSQSDLEVEQFLRRQVSFPVRCPPRKDAGFAVAGAGTCSLGTQPAAYLVGRVDSAPVSIFILSRDSLAAFPHQAAALKEEPIHRCREGNYEMALALVDRNLVLVIGQTPSEQLLRVIRAYGTYPHAG